MVASDVSLGHGAVGVLLPLAPVPAGDLPLSVADLLDRPRVVDVYVRDEVVLPLAGSAPDVLHVALGIGRRVVSVQQDGRVVIRERLPLEGRDRRVREDFLLRADHRHHLLLRLVHFGAEVLLLPGPRDRHVPADQETVASFQLVRADRVAVIRYSHCQIPLFRYSAIQALYLLSSACLCFRKVAMDFGKPSTPALV